MCESDPIGFGSQFMCSDWIGLDLVASMSDRIGSDFV